MSGEEFRALRGELGLTQRHLAEALQCSVTVIRDYEGGRAPIPHRSALAMQALQMNRSLIPEKAYGPREGARFKRKRGGLHRGDPRLQEQSRRG